MFDPWKQSKINNGFAKLSSVTVVSPQKETSVDDIRKLAGVTDQPSNDNITNTAAEKAEYMKSNNIKPGTADWFKLWFSRPYLTGESPFKE